MSIFEEITDVINHLVETGKISPAVANQQKQLLNHGFSGINPVIRKHYTVDHVNQMYVVR